jgi:hypothetical protein
LVFEYNTYKISYEKDHKWWLDKELGGDNYNLLQSMILALILRDWEKT